MVLSQFSILDYLNKLENVEFHSTWLLATCPHCGGKLKVATHGDKAGAFACYTSDCHKLQPNPIVKHVLQGVIQPKNYLRVVKVIRPPATPLPIKNIIASDYYSAIMYTPVYSYEVGNAVLFFYQYDDFQIVRVNPAEEKKFFYPRYKQDGEWVNKIPPKFKNIPVYRSPYIGNHVIFAEGEKAADRLQLIGINGLSFPSFVYSANYMPKFLNALSSVVKSIIYLEDDDVPGAKKRDMFLNFAWGAGIETTSFNIGKLLNKSNFVKGYDIADAVDEKIIKTRQELLDLLCNSMKFQVCQK